MCFCTSVMTCPVLASYQRRFSSSVATPSCTTRLPERSRGSASPSFSRHSLSKAGSSSPMMIRASEPPMKLRLLIESVIRLAREAIDPLV
jgi:hypothetical protein